MAKSLKSVLPQATKPEFAKSYLPRTAVLYLQLTKCSSNNRHPNFNYPNKQLTYFASTSAAPWALRLAMAGIVYRR